MKTPLVILLAIFAILIPASALADDTMSQLSPADQVQMDLADDGKLNSIGSEAASSASDSPQINVYNSCPGCEEITTTTHSKPSLPKTGAALIPFLIAGSLVLILGGLAWEWSRAQAARQEG
jgi:hypothetical protein